MKIKDYVKQFKEFVKWLIFEDRAFIFWMGFSLGIVFAFAVILFVGNTYGY